LRLFLNACPLIKKKQNRARLAPRKRRQGIDVAFCSFYCVLEGAPNRAGFRPRVDSQAHHSVHRVLASTAAHLALITLASLIACACFQLAHRTVRIAAVASATILGAEEFVALAKLIAAVKVKEVGYK
jgi:hypothetical protein